MTDRYQDALQEILTLTREHYVTAANEKTGIPVEILLDVDLKLSNILRDAPQHATFTLVCIAASKLRDTLTKVILESDNSFKMNIVKEAIRTNSVDKLLMSLFKDAKEVKDE